MLRRIAVVAVAALLAGAGTAHAVPANATASAGFGRAVVWLQARPADPSRRELVFQPSPAAAPRVLALAVPPLDRSEEAESLDLGRDAAGRLTLVLQTRTGLHWAHPEGSPRLRRVRGTSGKDGGASLFRGRVAYARSLPRFGSAVRIASLRGGRTRTAWSNASDPDWIAVGTELGRGDAVGILTARDGAGNGALRALLDAPGRPTQVLGRSLLVDDEATSSLSLSSSSDGRRLTVRRTTTGASRERTYAMPSGRRIASGE